MKPLKQGKIHLENDVLIKVLQKCPLVQVDVLFYFSRKAKPSESFSIDLRLSPNDSDLVYFKKRLWKEGLNERKTQLGMKSAALTVGYYQQCDGVKDPNSFTESFTNDQWSIGLHKVLTHEEFVITTRVMESTVVHSVPTAHQRSISCHLATEALVSQEKTECRKYAGNDQQTSIQLHVTEEDQDYVSEETGGAWRRIQSRVFQSP